jgi:predicted SnoaL-like aldol condensation-catalyzing enzyme
VTVPQQESTAGRPTRQEEFNKSLVERAFQDVSASDAFDEGAIARYFSPRYVQKTDGRTLDFPGFVAHVRELKRTLKNVKITFESAVAEGASVVSIHRAEAEKVTGGSIAIRVFALFVIEDGKIVLCDELTHLEQGAAEDRDLASRTGRHLGAADQIQQSRHIQRLRVSNSYSKPVTLCLEPWADELLIPPKVSFEIVAEGPEGDYLQVVHEESRTTVYGWSGSVLSVFRDGQLLLECDVPAPRTPPSSNDRSGA